MFHQLSSDVSCPENLAAIDFTLITWF